MRVFRIYTDGRLPNDAMGARIAGGRWNPKGYLVLYTATRLSLACLEIMVHLERGTAPRKLRYASTEIPVAVGSLDPLREYVHRGPDVTADVGKQWIVHRKELAIRAPSVLIPEEDNILLNPLHPEYDSLEWTSLPFQWETRLLALITAVPGN